MNSADQKSGAQVLYEALIRQGVSVIFGYPGSGMLPFYDQLYHSPHIRHILVRHEQAAAHAADGYARVSGKAGVCMATSGPGSTNLVTGIAAAFADSIPIVALTFNTSSEHSGKGVFQEVDIRSITKTIVKKSWRIQSVEEISSYVQEAFQEAMRYPRGPVLIDIPSDILKKSTQSALQDAIEYSDEGKKILSEEECASFFSLLSNAKRPVFIAGSGIIQSNSSEQFQRLVEQINVPIASTVSGVGSISETHSLALEVVGVLGTPYANSALQQADLIVAWGMHFEPRSTARPDFFAPNARIVQIDINHGVCGRFIQPTLCLNGEIRSIIDQVLHDSRLSAIHAPSHWLEQIALWKHSCALSYDKNSPSLQPPMIMETLESLAPRIRIFSGNGLHKYWALRHFHYQYPRQFNTNSRFGAMGFALPGAVGASIALSNESMVVITGDGDIQMTIQELATIVDLQVPLKILVFNNGSLGAIRQHQHFSYEKRFIGSSFEKRLPIAAIAREYGIPSETISHNSQIESAVKRALEYKGPYLIDCIIHPDTFLDKKISISESLDALVCPVEAIVDNISDLA